MAKKTTNEKTMSFEIKETIGVFGLTPSGWTKELNIVDWNEQGDKYDLRAWSADHSKCGKGITCSANELANLYEILKDYISEEESEDEDEE